MITVVSGQGRSGTSAMMRALEVGGLELLAHDDSPLRECGNTCTPVERLLVQAEGKAIKLLAGVPLDERIAAEHDIKIIWMRRDFMQQAKSFQKFKRDVIGEEPELSQEQLAEVLAEAEWMLLWRCEQMGDVLVVQFENLLDTPRRVIDAVVDWLDLDLDRRAMADSIVDRAPEARKDWLEKELYDLDGLDKLLSKSLK